MFLFFHELKEFYSAIIQELWSVQFTFSGVSFSLWHILVGFLLTSMLITIFWKGARG